MISSEADADKNKISTETLTWSDLKNEAEWESKTSGINVNIPGKSKEQEKTEKETGVKPPKGKDDGITPNFAGSDGEDDSTTKSGISEGTIDIRDKENQKQDIEDLNRDTTNTNDPLDKIFDKDKILEKEQAAALFGEIGFTLAGDIISKNDWKNDDPRSIALHGIIGGIMAEISGGSFGEGMTAAAINKLVIAKLGEMRETVKDEDGNPILGADGKPLTKPVFDGDELRSISTGLGGLISGNQGAGITDSATKNNYLTHAQSNEWLKLRGECASTEDPSQCKIDIDAYYQTLDRLQNEWVDNDKIKNPHYYDEKITSNEEYVEYFKANSDVEKHLGKPLIMEQLENKIDHDKIIRDKQLKEGVFQINSRGEKVYTVAPEHIKKDFEELGIDVSEIIKGSTLGRENDFNEIVFTYRDVEVVVRTDKNGNVYWGGNVEVAGIEWSALGKYNIQVKSGVVLDQNNNRVTDPKIVEEMMVGGSGSIDLKGFGAVISYSQSSVGLEGYTEQSGGISVNPSVGVSISVGRLDKVPEDLANVLKYIVRPPSINGMTEDQLDDVASFYRDNPNLKPFI